MKAKKKKYVRKEYNPKDYHVDLSKPLKKGDVEKLLSGAPGVAFAKEVTCARMIYFKELDKNGLMTRMTDLFPKDMYQDTYLWLQTQPKSYIKWLQTLTGLHRKAPPTPHCKSCGQTIRK